MCGECFLKWAKAFHTLKSFLEEISKLRYSAYAPLFRGCNGPPKLPSRACTKKVAFWWLLTRWRGLCGATQGAQFTAAPNARAPCTASYSVPQH